jgi:hypothetical protein
LIGLALTHQPEEPTGEAQQLVQQFPFSQTLQEDPADLIAFNERNDTMGDVAKRYQQRHVGHKKQEDYGKQCSGSYEERPKRPASVFPLDDGGDYIPFISSYNPSTGDIKAPA